MDHNGFPENHWLSDFVISWKTSAFQNSDTSSKNREIARSETIHDYQKVGGNDKFSYFPNAHKIKLDSLI